MADDAPAEKAGLAFQGARQPVLALVTADDADPDYFRPQLGAHEKLVHISVEVNRRRPAGLSAHSPSTGS